MLISTQAVDVVAVLDKNLNQVLVGASIIKAAINETSRVMNHPVESGGEIADEIVKDAITINLSIILNPQTYRAAYQEIKQLYNKRELLTVQTRTDSYQSLVIQAMPHDEDASIFDTVAIEVKLQEVVFIETEYEAYTPQKVRNPADASAKKRGEPNKTEATEQEYASTAAKITGVG